MPSISAKPFTHLMSVLMLSLSMAGLSSCNDPVSRPQDNSDGEQLTIFFINDQHGQIENFPKIKTIVDGARDSLNVLLVCAGDMFSGNPIVDQYSEKGYPMIDMMNKVGFDVSVIGNHEFDYGQEVLVNRMEQAQFKWVCANLDVAASDIPQPDPFVTIEVGGLTVTFLGLVETWGKPDDVIPSTHPWRVTGLHFEHFYDIIDQYDQLKENESADLLVALTHLGSGADRQLATNLASLDLVIGGHSHELIDEEVNETPIVQAGSYLHLLGQIDLTIKDQAISRFEVDFINLDEYTSSDATLSDLVAAYNDNPAFDEVIGFSESDLSTTEAGCFYTDAVKGYLHADFSLQNGGGVRAGIDQGDITTLDIYNMDPFNNQSVIFTMAVGEIKQFLKETRAGLHVAGITIEQNQTQLTFLDPEGNELIDSDSLVLGINDYIPAVYDAYFPLERASIQDFTTAESIISYLKTINSTIDYEGCNHYFRYE
jgi:5'-nucleotidase/UDP-sugar diphosphatase